MQLCQNYRTISFISHSSKVMLKIILNKLKPQAEEIIAERQAAFRAGRSTTEQVFNLRILCEKYLQHQQSLYHVFIDFKLENVFVKHYAPNHMPDPKGEWSLKKIIQNFITEYVQKFISASTPWSVTIYQL